MKKLYTLKKIRKSLIFACFLILLSQIAFSQTAPVWQTADQQQSSGSSTSLSVAKPGNLVEGDLIILVFTTQRSNSTSTSGFTTPTGFTLIRSEQDASSTSRPEIAAYYKIATASEPVNYTSTVTNNGSTPEWKATASRVTGHDPVSPIGNNSGTNSGTSSVTSLTIPTLNTTINNSLLVATRVVRASISGENTAGMTLAWTANGTGASDNNTNAPAYRGAWQTIALAGSTGTKQFTWTVGARAAGLMFAIKPNPYTADLQIAKTVSAGPHYFNDNVTFSLTASNLGPDNATGITVNDLLPAGYTYVSHNASTGTYDPGTGAWNGFNLNNASSATLSIVATIDCFETAYTNSATITGIGSDPVPGNNASTASTTPTNNGSTPCLVYANDDNASTVVNEPVEVNVIGNDQWSTNPYTLTVISAPSHGTYGISGGNITYTPTGGYTGSDQFTYHLCDNSTPQLCDDAVVHLTVYPGYFDVCGLAVLAKIYYLPFPENETQLRMTIESAILTGTSGYDLTNNARSITSIKVPYPNTIMIYDHWEDGYEASITSPAQSSTVIWGDGNLTNGVAPGYVSTDIIPAGGSIVLDNTFAYLPRVPSTIVYDGKDKIYSSADLAVSKVTGDAGNRFPVENLKTDVIDDSKFGTSFTIGFGENTNLPAGVTAFSYMAVYVRAKENGTVVTLVTAPTGGVTVTSPTLNEGEVFFYDGIGSSPFGVPADKNNASDIRQGATVTSNKPVGVDIAFGGIEAVFALRNTFILPGQYYGDTYYCPVYTTNTAGSYPAPVHAYFYNNSGTAITINWDDNDANTTANGTVSVGANSLGNLLLSNVSGYKFWSQGGESFVATCVIDADGASGYFDWAFTLINEDALSDATSVAWAPGYAPGYTPANPGNFNPVWVTPISATTLYVKYNGDLTSGGSVSPCGSHYDISYSVAALSSTRIFDPDYDQTGLAVFTCDDVKFAAVWGQDAWAGNSNTETPVASPGIDVGYVLQPKCFDRLIIATDDFAVTGVNLPVVIDIVDNDIGFLCTVDPASVTTTGLLQPAHGAVIVHTNGTVTYTPANGYVGTDQFEYSVCSIETPVICDVALVTVTITDCNADPDESHVQGYVFLEEDPDDGQYNGESFMPGIRVDLYSDNDCDGIIDTPTETLLQSMVTNSSGYFEFNTDGDKYAKDNFDPSGGATGNDGTANWSTNWLEVNETNGFSTSPVTIATDPNTSSYALILNGSAKGAERSVNFVNASGGTVKFDYRRQGLDNAGEILYVYINKGTGKEYLLIAFNDGDGTGTNNFYETVVYNIPSQYLYLSGTNTISFITNTNTLDDDYYYIDNVAFYYFPTCFTVTVNPVNTGGLYIRSTLDTLGASFTGLQQCDKGNYLGVIATDITLHCPNDTTAAACQTQTAINNAFNAWMAQFSYSGGCNTSVSTNPTTPTAPDDCGGSTTVTWTVTNTCGDPASCTKTFTVTGHISPPTQVGGPVPIASTVDCIVDVVAPTLPVVQDVCGNVLPAPTPVITGTYVNCEGTKIYTYTYTDCADLDYVWVYTYTIEVLPFANPADEGSQIACAVLAVTPTLPTVTDNCGNTLTPTGPTMGGTYVSCEGTITYTYLYTDCEGNTQDWVYTYTVERSDFTVPSNPAPVTVACIALATVPAPPTVNDNCGGAITPTGPVSGGTYDGCEGTRTYTWTYTDCELNTHDWVYTYTIERLPFANPADQGSQIACASLAVTPTLPTVTDNCGNTLTPTGPAMGGSYVSCEGTITYTYLYTDCEGNTQDWVYTYTVERSDFSVPSNPAPVTVACIALATVPTPPTVNDNCGNTITPTGPAIGGSYTTCEGTVTYTWTYTDCELNAHNWVYTYTIEYEPFAIATPEGSSTVDCYSDVTTPIPPTVYDNCGVLLTASTPVITGTYTSCEGTVIYTFTYTDCELNTDTWAYTYTIEAEDFLVNMPANGSSTVDCYSDITTPTPPVVTDNCGNTITPTGPAIGGSYTTCEGTVTYTWTYTDCELNAHIWVYTYTIEYEPFAIATPDGSATVDCYSDVTTPIPPTVYDNCGVLLTASTPVITGTYTSCEGTVIYTFTYTDCELNTDTWAYTYTIEVEDFLVNMPANGSSTVDCFSDITTPTPPVVTDNCGNAITPTGPAIGGSYTTCEGTVTYTWTYTDCELNAHNWVYTYTIEYEPFAIATPDGSSTVDCYSDVTTPIPPTVYDNCGVLLTASTPVITGTYTSCEGTVIYTFTYTDCELNTDTWAYTYTIEVEDFLVNMPANGSSTVDCFSDITTPTPPVVTDNCGNAITPTGPAIGGSYTTCEGTVTYTWTYTDCELNAHNWVYTYTIEYEPFAIATPEGSATVDCYSDVTTPIPPTVYDNCGVLLTASTPVITGTYTSCEGTVIYTFTYTDCELNTDTWAYTYTIEAEDFLVNMPANGSSTVDCYSDITTPTPPVVTDNCGNAITPTGPAIGGSYTTCEGTVTYTWTYTDCELNAHNWVYTYTIEYEPFAIATPDGSSTVDCYSDVTTPIPPTVYDNCGVLLTASTPVITGTYTSCEGTVIYTFTYTDCELNTDTWAYTYTIEVEDFLVNMPANGSSTVDCYSDITTPTPPVVTDNCGNAITPTGPAIGGSYTTCEGTVTYTWTYTDCELNAHIWVYTYTIEYETFAIATPDGSATVDCYSDVTTPVPPTVYDNCGVLLTASTPVITGTYTSCEGTVIYTFTYTDCELNTDTWAYTYTIEAEDFLVNMPANGSSTVDCYSDITTPTPPVVTDNCGNAITPTGPAIGGSYTTCEGTVTYTWTYTDCELNAHNWVYTYTIEYEPFAIATPDGSSTVDCYSDVTTPVPPTVYDNCGVLLTASTPVITGTYTSCEGTVIYTFTYTDCELNTDTWAYTYTIEAEDFLVNMPANGSSTVDCYSDITTPTPPVVTDNCGNAITPTGPAIGGSYTTCEGTVTYTWTYTDCELNAHIWVYTYTIEYEPFAIATPDGSSTVDCYSDVTTPIPPTVYDNCGVLLTASTPVITGTYTSCEGTVIYTFTYTDCELNTDTWAYTYTIEVEDFLVNMPANGSSTVDCYSDITTPTPPVVTDNCGNAITPTGPAIGGSYTTCEGTVTYTWTYTDCELNAHIWVYTYTIEYEPFAIATPDGSSTVDCYSDVTTPVPPTVYDNCGVLLTASTPVITGTYTSCEGTVIYTFTYTDCELNTDTWAYTYTIEVEDFLVNMPANGSSTVDCYSDITTPTPPVVTDNCGNAITPTGPAIGGSYTTCEGTVTYTWTYTDCELNAHNWVYTYTIEYEPFAIATPDGSSTVDCYSDVTTPIPPTVYDNCGVLLTASTPVITGTYTSCEGTVIYTFTYTDCELNTDTWAYTYTIEVEDFLVNMPANGSSTVDCYSDITTPTPPVVTDNCGNAITPTGPAIGGSYTTCEGTVTYTWTYTDCELNAHNWVYTYTIEYEPFAIATPDGSSTVDCYSDVTTPIPPTVYDNCGVLLTASTPVITGTYTSCEGTVIYTFTYTDCELNTDTWAYTYTIEVEDFLVNMPANGSSTVDCYSDITTPTPPVVTDNCGNAITPTGPAIGGSYTTCEGTVTYTWTYTDCELNAHNWVYTYTIEYEPFAIATPDGSSTVDCYSDVTTPIPPTVYDNCGVLLTASTPVITGTYTSCEGTVIYTFTYTDCELNTDTWAYTYTIEVEDFLVNMPANGSSTVDCYSDITTPTPPVVTDNCGNAITPTGPAIGGSYTTCEGTVTYTWTYTDCELNAHNWVYTYTIEYEPFAIATPDGSSTVDCYSDVTTPIPPTVYDNCGVLLTASTPVITGTYTSCEGTVIYTFTYTDCELNTDTWAYTYTIEVEDFLVNMPANGSSTVDCYSDITTPTPPVVTDNCGNAITPTGPAIGGSYTTCEGTVTYTWTYTDCELNAHNWVYTYTIEYEPFAIATPDGSSTVDCYSDVTTPIPPTVYDNCGVLLTASTPVITGTYTSCEGTVIYTFTYTDCELNTDTWAYTYTIEVEDFLVNMPANGSSTVDCYSDITTPTPPVVTDNCGNAITPTGPAIGGSYTTCEGTVTYTWTYTDCELNAHNWVYTYTIERLPFADPTDQGSTVACLIDVVTPSLPEVRDNCGNLLSPAGPTISAAPDCEGSITYLYTYTDCEGNYNNWVYTYTIEREDFTMPTDDGSTVACIADVTLPTPPAVNDNCGNAITPTGPAIGGSYTTCEGTVTYTWTYTDCELNTHDWVYTYTIERLPFADPPDQGSIIACAGDIVTPTLPVVSDNCGNLLSPEGPTISAAPDCEGTITYLYTYTDCEGNYNNWVYTYTIERLDFTMPADDGSTVACITDVTIPTPPVVNDNCGNAITPTGPVTGGTYISCEGTRTYTWTYTDCEGNTHDWVYTYTIEREDFLVNMPGNGSSTVACIALAVQPLPPTVNDNCGNAITPTGPVIGGTYVSCEGTRTYTWTYTDCEGNTHNWVYTYTIERLDFTMPPNNGSFVPCIANATVPTPPVVTDNCGNPITPTGPTIGGTYNGCEGRRTYTFKYTDCEGNNHNWVYTYTIEREDFTMPLNGSSTVACIAQATLPVRPIINDNCGNPITPTGPTIGGTYVNCEGTRTYTWNYRDCEGNNHNWVYTYTIEVLPFSDPPDEGSTVACAGDIVTPTLPVVNDNCGNLLSPEGPTISAAPDCEGAINYLYTYTDCEGNSNNWVYTYTIEREDFTPPVNSGSTVACAALAVTPVLPTVNDNCGNLVTPTGPAMGGSYINCEGTITFTYNYADCEGNNHDWVYTYTVEREDFTMPADDGSTVACIEDATQPTAPPVNDNCGNLLIPTGPIIGGTYLGCEGTRTYTWNYRDCEGNNHDWIYTYTIERLPFADPPDQGSTVACLVDVVLPSLPEVRDNCGNLLTPVGPTVSEAPDCEGIVTYLYTYVDCEGNSNNWVYTYTIEVEDFLANMPPDAGETISCYDQIDVFIPPALNANDFGLTPPLVLDYCGYPIIPSGPSVGGTWDGCEGTVTFTWTYTDCEGNTHDWTYTYTIERLPFADPPDQGSTVACLIDVVTPDLPEVRDNCGFLLSPEGPTISEAPDCEGTITYLYTYTDCEGNSNNWVYTYTIERLDFTMPADDGSTVACIGDVTLPTPPAVNDNCGNAITPTGPVTGGTYAGCEGTRTYTWTYTDCEGNYHDWVYTYTIERLPFADPPDQGSTVACLIDVVTPILPEVMDNCGNLLTPVGPTVSEAPDCEGTITYLYTYTDCEGNYNNWVYTYTIERLDFTMPFDEGSTVACIADATQPDPPPVNDNCGDLITPTGPAISGTYTSCEGTRTYSWTYTDCEGNTHDWVYTYTIERLPFADPSDQGSTVACLIDVVTPTLPDVWDNCGNLLTPVGPTVSEAPDCEGTITYLYTYSDCEGNSNNWVYTYTIERLDFTLPADDGSTVACIADVIQPTPPAVYDNCANAITPTGPVTGGTYTSCEGTRTYTWNYEDCEGNNHDWVYTYIIERLPFADPPDQGSAVACLIEVVIPTLPEVRDNCGNLLSPAGPTISAAPDCEGTITYLYTYTDCEGNFNNWVYTYTIERLDFTMPADDGSTVACIADVILPTPPAVNDNCGNTITPTGPVTGGTYAGCEGTRTYTWNYTDCEGNTHDWVYTYTIEREDFTPPANTGTTVACAALAVTPALPTVYDNCGNLITPTGPVMGGSYVNCEGTITFTYNYADCEGNNHDWVYTYSIEVEDFVMPPDDGETIDCISDIHVYIPPPAGVTDFGLTPPPVYDNCGNLIHPTGPSVGGNYNGCEGTVTFTWNYADCEGNNHDWVYTYTIEYEPFTITTPDGGSTVDCIGDVTIPVPPAVTDNCGNSINPTGPVTGGTYVSCEGTKTYTWTYTDCEGNTDDWTYTYNIDDNEPPTLTCPDGILTVCDVPEPFGNFGEFEYAGGSASDNCGLDEESFIWVSDVPSGNTIIRTYKIKDECGNEGTCEQIITIIDVDLVTGVYLEGSAINPEGIETYTLPMRTSLNALKVLPGQTYSNFFTGTVYSPPGQPYSGPPWNYSGTEGAGFDSHGNPTPGTANYPSTVTDWVLVSLRATPTGQPLCMKAALLHNNGDVEFVNGGFDCCDVQLGNSYYVVIEHRNHLIVMSHIPVPVVDGAIEYDFRVQQSYIDDPFGFGGYGQKEILPGIFAMYAGNGNQVSNTSSDTDINFGDRTYWEGQNGITGRYRNADYNLNGDCNYNDRTTWEFNNGKFSTVPRN